MSEFEVNIPGTKVRINTNDSIEDIKKKLPQDKVELIFQGVDTNESGTIDTAGELDTFKKNLNNAGYTVSEDSDKASKAQTGGQSQRAYNNTIQNLKIRYDENALKGNFEQADDKLHPVKKGDTLWVIAKKALVDEGLNPTGKAINDRIAQIAAMNNLNNVNDVRVGTKLIVHLTSAGVEKVKSAEGQNSAQALAGIAPAQKVQGKKQEETQNAKQGTKQTTQTTVQPSTITLNKNVNMADEEGWTASSDQTDVSTDDFTNFNSDTNVTETVTKYETTEGEVTKTVYQYEAVQNGVHYYLQADTLEGLKTKYNAIAEKQAEIKPAPENELEEDAKTRMADNLTAIKEYLALTDNNIEYVKEAITTLLKDDTLVDKNSDEFKAFVDNLIRTKNPEVLTAILKKKDGENEVYDNSLLVNDEQSSRDVAGLLAEIRAKEKAGIRLDKNEIALKGLLNVEDIGAMYTIQADSNNNIHEKSMLYSRYSEDGHIYYEGTVCNIVIQAETEEKFEEFAGKLEEANKETDTEKKQAALQALFKEYSTTTDKGLAMTLAQNATALNPSQEDFFNLIDNNDSDVIEMIPVPASYTDEANKALVDKVIAKYESEFSKGDIGNADYLSNAFAWLDKRGDVTEGEGENAKTTSVTDFKFELIKNGFFSEVPAVDNEGNPVDANNDGKQDTKIVFKPNRRPTAEEMEALLNAENGTADGTFKIAIIEAMDVENDTEGQYTKVIEDKFFDSHGANFKARYEKHIESLETAEELEEFVKAKDSLFKTKNSNYDYNRIVSFPFDKIMEKLETLEPVDNDTTIRIKSTLLELICLKWQNREDLQNSITDENRLKLIQSFILTDEETGEKSIRPGVSNFYLAQALPIDCTEGEAFETYRTLLMNFDVDKALVYLMNGEGNINFDKDMINHIVEKLSDPGISDYGNFTGYATDIMNNDRFKTQVWAKLTPEQKDKIFENMNPYSKNSGAHNSKAYAFMITDLGMTPPKGIYAVRSGDTIGKLMKDYLVTEYDWNENDAVRYVNRCTSYLSQSGLDKLQQNSVINLNDLPWSRFNGYRYGEAMFAEVKGFNSGDIRKMLKGEHDTVEINKDTVVGIIEQFNSHKDEDRIMTFLDGEAGPSKDEMNVIPNALLEKAKEIGLEADEAYTNLASFVAEQSGSFWDYGPSDAKKMDDLIDALLKKMYETGKNGYPLEAPQE